MKCCSWTDTTQGKKNVPVSLKSKLFIRINSRVCRVICTEVKIKGSNYYMVT
jgi:hypothetical protein